MRMGSRSPAMVLGKKTASPESIADKTKWNTCKGAELVTDKTNDSTSTVHFASTLKLEVGTVEMKFG